jgi:hypothetical protein
VLGIKWIGFGVSISYDGDELVWSPIIYCPTLLWKNVYKDMGGFCRFILLVKMLPYTHTLVLYKNGEDTDRLVLKPECRLP